MVGKLIFKIMTLCMAMLCCHACGEKSAFINIEHPFIRIVNQSDDTIWIEALNQRGIEYFKGVPEDSLFYGIDEMVLPHSMKQLMSRLCPFWEGELYGRTIVEDNFTYIARVFIMDSCTSVDINMARIKYYRDLYQTDSIQVIEALKKFEKNHLLHKHWYTKKELDSINWTIVYPQK